MKKKDSNFKLLLKLFSIFFKIGMFTFGGGFAMIPLIEKEIVEKHKWIEKDEFVDSISLTQTVPGPVAVNLSVLIGYNLSGIPGAIISVFGIALPSFTIILIIASFFEQFSNNPLITRAFMGIRPAVVALILYSAFKLSKNINWFPMLGGTFIVTVIAKTYFGISPVFLIIGAAIFGLIYNVINNKVLLTTKNQEE
ncbi:MAG: chromate transporter [Halanaerobiales bacterium]|nr:chromate transporter [Halanaerobiales bacterium]